MSDADNGQAPQPVSNAAASGRRFHFVAADAVITPLALFFAVYLAALFLGGQAAGAAGLWYPQWVALFSVAASTVVALLVWERGRWNVGLAVMPALAGRDLLLGVGFAVALIAVCDALVIATTGLRHAPGTGIPWFDLAAIMVPAAIHEEILFRGYVFQKLRRWRRGAAYFFSAIVFAALHANNTGITPLAYLNLALAGVLLGLAWERYARLWFPIGIHLAWNVLSGPVLGHEVSGYVASESLIRTTGEGTLLLTGGEFGIEGSIWMTVCELVGVLLLWKSGAGPRDDASRMQSS